MKSKGLALGAAGKEYGEIIWVKVKGLYIKQLMGISETYGQLTGNDNSKPDNERVLASLSDKE